MTARFSNQFQSYLTEPLNIDATVINIPPEDVKRLPILNDTDWCPLNINDPRGYEEIVHVTKVNADGSLTVKRAQEGTEAKNFRVESRVDIRLTAQSIESFLGLYYGARTVPPSNAQTGAAYLDISQKPNALKVLGDNGWANAVSYSLAGLRQQLFVPTEATKGPFTVPGGFTSGFANVNGLSVYAGHGMTIDAANASFKLDAEVPAGTIIVFQGYLANDAVDVFTKAEINERLSNLSTGDLKETDDRKFMTADDRQSIVNVNKRVDGLTTNDVKETPDHKYFPPNFNADDLPETDTHKIMTDAERNKIASLDNTYFRKSGGTITGDVVVEGSTGTTYFRLPDGAGTGYPTLRLGYVKDENNYFDFNFNGSSVNITIRKFGDVVKFYDDGTTRFADAINIQGKTYWQTDGNISGPRWYGGSLYSHIENRFNSCVTNSRQIGWTSANTGGGTLNGLPSGYFTNGIRSEPNGTITIGGAQLQLYIQSRGWFPLATW